MSGAAIEILYEEGPCLVVNKPPGLLTQAPPGIDSLEWRIKEFLRQRDSRLGRVYLGVPHRLDRPASGAMVFGTHSRAAHRLSKQFERREVGKTYWACVSGIVEPAEGTWINYTRKIPDQARAEVVGPEHPEGREAILRYRVLGAFGWGTWLEVALETGRMHQVRSRPPPEAIRWWGTNNTARRSPSAPNTRIRGSGPSPCTPGRSASNTP